MGESEESTGANEREPLRAGESQAQRVQGSRSYHRARSKAAEYVNDPQRLNELVRKAGRKADAKKGPLEDIWAQLTACFRLIRAYAKGAYREIPWSSLVMLVAAIVYFVMPVDVLPDFLVGLGLLDDAALLGWTIRTLGAEIDAFAAWESTTSESSSNEQRPSCDQEHPGQNEHADQ
jgi:uncharacterized membrane protein YkvA (DUF1232 family)